MKDLLVYILILFFLLTIFSQTNKSVFNFDFEIDGLEEIIIEHIKPYAIPLVFNFPAGHINDNRALVFGKKIKLEVFEEVKVSYI